MFFRRSKKKATEITPEALEEELPPDRRGPDRVEPLDRSDLNVSLEPWSGDGETGQVEDCTVLQLEPPIDMPVRGRLLDLCIQGACIRVSRADVPGLEENHVVGMRIIHPTAGWEVVTPAMVRLIDRVEDNGMSNIGVEFVNPGQLYAQLEDDLGRYFNRRNSERVRPQGEELKLRIKVRGTRITAKVFDVSVVGLGAWVDTVLSACLKLGDDVSFALELPGRGKTIEGTARVARFVAQGRTNYLGLKFDVAGGSENAGIAAEMRRYVGQYLDERLRRAA